MYEMNVDGHTLELHRITAVFENLVNLLNH